MLWHHLRAPINLNRLSGKAGLDFISVFSNGAGRQRVADSNPGI
jgi:hypothetical protein